MTRRFAVRKFTVATRVASFIMLWPQIALAQNGGAPSPGHVVIPFLVNATKLPIEFEGGECELDSGGSQLACTFQQVFLTTSAIAPDTCLITTNRYDRVFHRESAGRWVSTETPEGACGLLDVTTLQDDGGVRWTMETHKVVTKGDASACRADDSQPEKLSWENARRPLPCKFVQPGGLSR